MTCYGTKTFVWTSCSTVLVQRNASHCVEKLSCGLQKWFQKWILLEQKVRQRVTHKKESSRSVPLKCLSSVRFFHTFIELPLRAKMCEFKWKQACPVSSSEDCPFVSFFHFEVNFKKKKQPSLVPFITDFIILPRSFRATKKIKKTKRKKIVGQIRFYQKWELTLETSGVRRKINLIFWSLNFFCWTFCTYTTHFLFWCDFAISSFHAVIFAVTFIA